MRTIVHAITPGDHYSPRTGSAIPTVVHGLASAATAAGAPRHAVLLDESTFVPRYDSAELIEYSGTPLPSLRARTVDVALGRLGLPRRAAAAAFRPVADALSHLDPSFVLAHNAPALPPLLRRQPHTAILYAHNDVLRTLTRSEASRTLADVTAIVCVSEAMAEITRSRLPDSLAARVRVVENGVDVETFHPNDSPRSDRSRLRVMFLGRMIHDKGADVVVSAAALLDRDDVEFVLVGSAGFDRAAQLTPYEESLRRSAAPLGDRVSFERFVDRATVPDMLRTADVFVVPSRWADPSPLTAGEALASGLAVIGTRMGGIPEALGDAGVLVNPGDPRELAAAIEHLAEDAAELARLQSVARARAETRSWTNSWSQLHGVLATLA